MKLAILILFNLFLSMSILGQEQMDFYGGNFVNFNDSSVILDMKDSLAMDRAITSIKRIGLDSISRIVLVVSYDFQKSETSKRYFYERISVTSTYLQAELNVNAIFLRFRDYSSLEYIPEYGEFYIRILPFIDIR